MAHVTFPRDSFKTAARDYTKENGAVDACFWRELLQNARDAGATRVDCSVEYSEDEALVIFRDNGKGMTADVLRDGMLTYSGSVKSVGNAGGFGMAKCLLVFAPLECQIRTLDSNVIVHGLEYDVLPVTEHLAGAEFVIRTNLKEESTMLIRPSLEGLKYLMDRSDMGQMAVYFGGELIRSAGPACGLVVRSFPEMNATAYWNEHGTPVITNNNKSVVIRHRGLWVMDMPAPDELKGCLVVDILRDAKSVLNANRVNLAYGSDRQSIAKLISDLARSPKSVLHPKRKTIVYKGDLEYVADIEVAARATAAILRGEASPSVSTGIRISDSDRESIIRELSSQMRMIGSNLNGFNLSEKLVLLSSSPTEEELSTWASGNAYMIVNEDDENDIPTRYMRESLSVRANELLTMWREMIRVTLMDNRIFGVFGVGFILGHESQAAYKYNDGCHFFLINPELSDGSMRYKLSDSDCRENMIVSACHEVAHRVAGGDYHGDTFTTAYDTILLNMLKNRSAFNNVWKKTGRL